MKRAESKAQVSKRHKATTPEAREDQLIALAVDVAEKQLQEGTASPSVITHFLKLGSTKERLEKEMLAEQKKLVEAKTEAIQSAKRIEELYAEALKSMRTYSGQDNSDEEEEIYD